MSLRSLIALTVLLFPNVALSASVGADSGLVVPRFVSLGADKVNLRTGPGFLYPVAWVFVREALPVEVIDEYGDWRQVRDFEGAEGWVHRVMLSGRRTVLVTGGVRTLLREPRSGSSTVARAEAGVQGQLSKCHANWCEVDLDGHRGWMPSNHLWGVHAERGGD